MHFIYCNFFFLRLILCQLTLSQNHERDRNHLQYRQATFQPHNQAVFPDPLDFWSDCFPY